MKKAVFIDRDGVINSDVGHYYIYKPEDFILNDGVIEGLKLLRNHGFIFIVITNQGGISRGQYGHKDVEKVHNTLISLLEAEGITLTDIYYCPHHSDNEKCLCRKPGNVNIEKALVKYDIDRNQSWMIGDSIKDVEAGKRSGLKTIKIDSNENIIPYCKKIVGQD